MKPESADELARRILDALPRGVADLDHNLRRNLRAAVTNALARLEVVTRDEFDVQARLLVRTREKLDRLERRAEELERRLRAADRTR